MCLLIEYIYKGKAEIPEDRMESFKENAKKLQLNDWDKCVEITKTGTKYEVFYQDHQNIQVIKSSNDNEASMTEDKVSENTAD